MSGELEFKVSSDLVKPIIEAKINAAVIEAMGGHERFIHDIVGKYLSEKVDENGKHNSYERENRYTRAEAVLMGCINDAMKEQLAAIMAEKKEEFRDAILSFFRSKRGTSIIVDAITTGLAKSLASEWRTKIEFNLVPQRD